MRVGIDIQVAAEGNRSGLFTLLKNIVGALSAIDDIELTLFAIESAKIQREKAAEVSERFGGARVSIARMPPFLYRAWLRLAKWNRMDVLLHNLHGRVPPSARAANTFLVPDLIPLAVDYGIPRFADLYRPFYEAAAKHGAAVLVFSEHTKLDFLSRMGGEPERVFVAPLAAGPEFQPVRDRARLSSTLAPHGLDQVPFILYVATIEKRKNHTVLLRAFSKLVRNDPSIRHRLVFTGDKWVGHEAVFDEIAALGLSDRVTYLGYVEDLPALYSAADVFVFPSRYEGFGLPPLEAMACGVPVIAANTSSLPEVVGGAGLLFDPDDEDALVEHLRQTLADRQLTQRLRGQGLERAGQFSWCRTAEQYRQAFEYGMVHRRN